VSSTGCRQAVLRDGLLIIAFGQVCATSTIVGGDGIGLHIQCLVTLLDGTIILASKVENPSGGDSGSRINWVQLLSGPNLCQSLVSPALFGQEYSVHLVCIGVARAQIGSKRAFVLCSGPIVISEKMNRAQRSVCVS